MEYCCGGRNKIPSNEHKHDDEDLMEDMCLCCRENFYLECCCAGRNKTSVKKIYDHPNNYIKNNNTCSQCNSQFKKTTDINIAKIWKTYFLFCSDKCYSNWLVQRDTKVV